MMKWFPRLFSKNSAEHPSRSREDHVMRPSALKGAGADTATSSLPRFHGSAADRMHATRATPLDRARFRLRSAFTPSQPIIDARMFAGRAQVLRTLIRSIEDQLLHVVLYGDRGIGKTSLLHVLTSLAREARYIVRYASCGEETEFSDMFRAIAKDIPLLFHADYAPTSEESEEGRSLADLLPDGQVTVPQLTDLFAKISGTRVLIVLDEFDRAHSHAFRRSIAELIKNLSDRSIRVQLVVAGVASNLNELIEHIPSIRRNILGLQVPRMTGSEIEELVHNGEAVCGLTFDPEAISLVTAVAYGSPYIASLLSQHAGLSAIDRKAKTVGRIDVTNAISQAVNEIVQRVSAKSLHYIARAKTDGHERNLGLIARAALHAGGRLTAEQVEIILDSSGSANDYLEKLRTEYGLVEKVHEDPGEAYQFVEEGVPVFLWMQLAQVLLTGEQGSRKSLDALLASLAEH